MRVCSSSPAVRSVVVRSSFWLALLLAASGVGGLVSPAARGDIQAPLEAHTSGERLQRRGQDDRRQPAIGSAQKVEIHQGETIEVVLQGRGQAGKTIEFTIRSQPAHGTLAGPPRQLTRNTASVTYIHRAEDGPGDDDFTYAVQAAGTARSAAVPVSIKVLDLPPSLAATPAELDFGAVKAGESTRATLTLENRGGGTASGHVEPPPPWTVDGASEYHLAHGETASFQLVFQPSYGRSYVESEHFRLEEGRGVRLIGTGIGPHDPSEDLTHGPADTATAGSAAEDLARNNALARAAENAAVSPGTAALVRPLPATPPPAPTNAAVAVAATPLPPSPGSDGGAAGNGTLDLAPDGADSVVVNEATVKTIELRGAGTSTLDLAWVPPRPTPRSYRVELRYLSLDENDKLRVDWRPYAKVDIHSGPAQVTARVSGLPAGTRQTMRVVAVDDAGRLALPSAMLVAETRVASTWWHVTPLKTLVFMLLVCVGLLIYRKWEEQQILRSIDESRAESRARDAEVSFRR